MLKHFSSKDEQCAKMQALYVDTNISDEERCHINFGLAKAFGYRTTSERFPIIFRAMHS